jgi:integral membrane protein
MIKAFRLIALFEGLTTIGLFLIAMPAKYLLGQPALVPPIGALHGAAVVIYLVAMVVAFSVVRAPFLQWLRAFFACIIPFGTFINDHSVRELDRAQGVAA